MGVRRSEKRRLNQLAMALRNVSVPLVVGYFAIKSMFSVSASSTNCGGECCGSPIDKKSPLAPWVRVDPRTGKLAAQTGRALSVRDQDSASNKAPLER